MPHKGKKKYLKADSVSVDQKIDSTVGTQVKNGDPSAPAGTQAKKFRTQCNHGTSTSETGNGGKGDRGGGAGMQHVKSAISRAKNADAVLQACTKGSEGVQSLSVNACCMALYAVAKMTVSGGKGGKGGKGGRGGKGSKGGKGEIGGGEDENDGAAGSDEQIAESAQRWVELLEVVSTKVNDFDAKALTKATWALASLARRWPLPSSVMVALAQRCSSLASEFDAMAVASVLASFVKLTDASSGTRVPRIDSAAAATGNSAASAQPASGEACREAVTALHVRASAIASTFNGQDVANTLHACAKLLSSGRASRPSDALIACLTGRATSPEVLPTLRPKELVNILWACSTLRAATAAAMPPTTLSALFQAVHKQCTDTFTSRDVSTVLWSLARGFSSTRGSSKGVEDVEIKETVHGNTSVPAPVPVSLLKALAARATNLVHTFNGQDVANTLWALAKLSSNSSTGRSSVNSNQSSSSGSIQGSAAVSIANDKNYLAAFPPIELVAALEGQFARVLPTCNGQNVSNGLWAITKLNRSLPLNVLEAACARLPHVTNTMQPLQVADVLWALGNDRRNHTKGPGARAAVLLADAVTPETVANMTPHDLAIAGFALARIASSSSPSTEENEEDDAGGTEEDDNGDGGREDHLKAIVAAGDRIVAQAAKFRREDDREDLTVPQLCYLLWASAKLCKVSQTIVDTLDSAPAALTGSTSISDVVALAKALKPSLNTLHAQNVGLVAWAIAVILAETATNQGSQTAVSMSSSDKKSIAKFAKALLLRATELSPADLGWQSVAHVDGLRRGLMAYQAVLGGKTRTYKELHKVLIERAVIAADALTAVTCARTRAVEDAVAANKDLADWCAGSDPLNSSESVAGTSHDNDTESDNDRKKSHKKLKKSHHKKDGRVSESTLTVGPTMLEQKKQLLLVGLSAELVGKLVSTHGSPESVHVSRWLRFAESSSSSSADQAQDCIASAYPPLPYARELGDGNSSSTQAPMNTVEKRKKRSSSSSVGDKKNSASGDTGADSQEGGLFDGAVVRLPLAKAACDMALHMCAARLKPGAPLWGVALADESCAGRLPTLQQQEQTQPQPEEQDEQHQSHKRKTSADNTLPLWEAAGLSPHEISSKSSSSEVSQGELPAIVIWRVTRTTASATRSTTKTVSSGKNSGSLQGFCDGLLSVWAKDSVLNLPSWTEPARSKTSMPTGSLSSPLPPPLVWRTYPGLFARGGLDVMTAALLNALPPPPAKDDSNSKRPRLLDFACGSGTIGAALLQASPSAEVHFLDADAVALEASKVNVPPGDTEKQRVFHHLSDGFANLDDQSNSLGSREKSGKHIDNGDIVPSPKRVKKNDKSMGSASSKGGDTPVPTKKPLRFDWIVSNPPVHCGLTDDFHVVRSLAAGAPERLRPGGSLWIVAQSYVPVGALLEAVPAFDSVDLYFTDGRFAVWKASVP